MVLVTSLCMLYSGKYKYNDYIKRVLFMKVIILNTTLKNGTELSHTEALASEAASIFESEGVDVEMLRVNDYSISYGIDDDMGEMMSGPKY